MNRIKVVLKNSALLTKCFLHLLLHGRANKKINYPKSIVIVQGGQFGDMIATTPMFRAVKKSYPDCRVTVVGSALNKKVIDGNPDVDEYIVWSDKVSAVISRLKSNSYDFGCTTGPNFLSLVALFLGGVPSIAAPVIKGGWSPYETRPYKLIRNFVVAKEHWMRRYVPREYLKLLEPVGVLSDDTKKYIYWTSSAGEKAKQIISSLPSNDLVVGVMPGAGNTVKQWPAERFGAVADYIVEKYNAHILIIGSEINKEEIVQMLGAVTHKDKITNTLGTTIDEVKALVSMLDMTVSVDTGPVFIAEASGVPTVDIAGSIDVNEMAPNDGNKHLVVKSEGEPQIWTMNATVYDYKEARRQIESITVQMVTDKVDELVKKNKLKE